MELLMVVAIIGILVVIAIPTVMHSVKKVQETTCLANRETLRRSYRYDTVFADLTQEQAVQRMKEVAETAGYTVSVEGTTLFLTGLCPSDGTISVTISVDLKCEMTCSVHATTGGDNDDGGGDTGDDENTIVPADKLDLKGWSEALEAAASSQYGGIFLSSGKVWQDDTGTYATMHYCYLRKKEGKKQITLQNFMHRNPYWIVKLDLNAPPLTEADTETIYGYPVWKEDRLPYQGTIAQVGEDYYVCTIDSISSWTVSTEVANSILWKRISK